MRLVFLIFFAVYLTACSLYKGEKDPASYYTWLNDPDNGLVQEKRINGLVFSVKYMPPEFLAYQDLKNSGNYTQKQKDSVIASYSSTMTFLLSVNPDEKDSSNSIRDVMYLGVENMEDYQQRSMMMNFEMNQYLELKTSDSSIYSPVLVNMENTYSLSKGRSFTCVFSPLKNNEEFKNSKQFDFVWDDEIFDSGRNHFVFDPHNIFSSPSLTF
ncbi:MAG: hypothetical protein JWO58_3116 [Chitinophagaceae bacterium]|nr:hypothetical protein [Chitinophagaceae bacterium]